MLFMGKLTISMAIFNSYVCLPEGNITMEHDPYFFYCDLHPLTWLFSIAAIINYQRVTCLQYSQGKPIGKRSSDYHPGG